jgi:type II secretory pathway component PulC
MKKEYSLKLSYDDKDDVCDVTEEFKEEEVVFTINNKDVICPNEMSRILLRLDNTILGLA